MIYPKRRYHVTMVVSPVKVTGGNVIWVLVFPKTLRGHRAGTHFWQALCTHSSKLKWWKEKSGRLPTIWTLIQSKHSAKVSGSRRGSQMTNSNESACPPRWVRLATHKSRKAIRDAGLFCSTWVQKRNQRQMLCLPGTGSSCLQMTVWRKAAFTQSLPVPSCRGWRS